ncbi:MAG: ABC transporter ATP-binding protein [Burkholderiales bacterium]|nr:ABC transporter ATP-binding protein [Burkholderiales bacterium]
MSGVNVKNLGIRFGSNAVIEHLDLAVNPGEFLVLLGPSGCGKSTLLHSIAGLIDVAEGSIEIGGNDVTEAEPNERGIGMVFQSYALYPTMTVERNMSFGLRVSGTPKPAIEERVKRAARMLQLEPLLQRKPSQLSGGQRQRVAIGRALVRDANVFLLDEPLSNLDAKLRTELRRELKLLHNSLGATMIYVTHDQVEAMTLATRVVVMRGGKIQQIGAPVAVYERPENLFVAGFLGAPGMNFLKGELTEGDSGAVFTSTAVKVPLDPATFKVDTHRSGRRAVVLGIRPEDIRIHEDGELSGTVQLVEPMGNHRVVWINMNGISLSAVLHDDRDIRTDSTIRYSFDVRRVSCFDEATEQRL